MPGTENFGAMLRRLRTSTGLSQERLAERSGISAAGIAALEAGRRRSPRLSTVGLLCDGLGLEAGQRADLIAAAAGGGVERAPHPPSRSAVTTEDRSTSLIGPHRFVGRLDELHELRAAWDRRTRVALLVGEAGVGKSTLAVEFAHGLAAGGVSILIGRSTPQQLGAYESFIDPVRTAVERLGPTVPGELLELGRLVPGLVSSATDRLVPSRSDPSTERRLLFEAVASLLASSGPTLLVLDDLHWADAGTLALLTFLASHAHLSDVMIIGTVRSTDATAATNAALADLRRQCTVARIPVDGMTRSELAELVSDVAGGEVPDGLIDTVSDATSGNPLYIRELTEHLLRRGFDQMDGALPIPDGIRHTIELRVEGLSPPALALLRSGSVLGQQFEPGLAGRMSGLEGEALLGAIEDALLSGLVVERTAAMVAFSHGLVSAAIYEGVSRVRRLALHRTAAAALAERDPVAAGEIVDVARHWGIVAIDDPTARDTSARWSVLAGDAASAAASIDEAITCYRRAVSAWDEPTAALADALVRLGSSLMAAGQVAEGKDHLGRALLIADQADDAVVFARAALGLSASVRYTMSDPERIDELERAIAKFEPTEMVLRPALLATLRRQLGFVDSEEAERRRRETAESVATVVASPDVSDELLISLGSLRDSLVVDDPEPLGRLARDIIRVAAARQDLPVLSTGWYRQAWSALELGQADLFRRAVAEYRTIAERLRRPYELALSSNMIAAVAQIEGRYADAEAAGQEALAHASKIDDGNFGWVYFANSGIRAYDTGPANPTFELMRAVRADFGSLSTFEAAYAAMAAAAGEDALVRQLFDEQIGADGEVVDRNWSFLSAERLPVLGMWGWACGVLGDVPRASVVRARLERIALLGVRAVRIAPVGAWIGPLDHHLGVLSRVMGELDDAEAYLQSALKIESEMNGRTYTVRTLCELAVVARERGGPGARGQAAELRGRAEQLAAELGLETMLATCPGDPAEELSG